MPTGTAFDSLSAYAPSNTAQSGLAGQAAQQNIAASGDMGTLATLLQNINNTNNTNRVYGGAQMGQQSSQNISNELAGVLPQSFLDTLQSGMAQRGASGGFGVDSANTNAAALRAMGLQAQQLQQQGQTDLTASYNRAAPLVDASQFAMTPGLLETQQQNYAQNALQAQAQANSVAQWQAQLGEQKSEYGQSLQQSKDAMAAQYGLAYSQLNQAQKQFVDSQAQQASQYNTGQQNQMTQWGGSLAAQIAQSNAQNALEQARQQEQMQQFAAQQAQQRSEFGTTSGQNAAQLYAQTYHALPGYNQYGAYTGQTGASPTSTQTLGQQAQNINSNFTSAFGGGYGPLMNS
jgi:hypothetical protein